MIKSYISYRRRPAWIQRAVDCVNVQRSCINPIYSMILDKTEAMYPFLIRSQCTERRISCTSDIIGKQLADFYIYLIETGLFKHLGGGKNANKR